MFARWDMYDLALTHTFAWVRSVLSSSSTHVCRTGICMILIFQQVYSGGICVICMIFTYLCRVGSVPNDISTPVSVQIVLPREIEQFFGHRLL